jgi:ABC-type transporter Mla MlaB component
VAAIEPSAAEPATSRPSRLRTIFVTLNGPIDRWDIDALCERLRALLEESAADLVVCDVGPLVLPDAVAVDAVARLQLTARRLGRELRLRRAPGELQELLTLVGLRDVVARWSRLRLELQRQPEEGEQASRVQEEIGPDDPAA